MPDEQVEEKENISEKTGDKEISVQTVADKLDSKTLQDVVKTSDIMEKGPEELSDQKKAEEGNLLGQFLQGVKEKDFASTRPGLMYREQSDTAPVPESKIQGIEHPLFDEKANATTAEGSVIADVLNRIKGKYLSPAEQKHFDNIASTAEKLEDRVIDDYLNQYPELIGKAGILGYGRAYDLNKLEEAYNNAKTDGEKAILLAIILRRNVKSGIG